MKKKELRNVIRKKRLATSFKTVSVYSSLSKKDWDFLKSECSPWDYYTSKSSYESALKFIKETN